MSSTTEYEDAHLNPITLVGEDLFERNLYSAVMGGREFSPRDYDGPPVYRVHMLEAMAAADPCEDEDARTTYIRFGDQEYPLKHIVHEATERAGNRTEGPKTNEMEPLVEDLGFEVVKSKS